MMYIHHYVMSMHENTWECMRMASCSRDGWVVYGWVALHDMHDNVWECMRMTEVDWESLIFDGGRSLDADLHYTTCMIMNWECIWLSHYGWTCLWWECMRMTENVSYPWRGVGHSMLICSIRHAWECMRIPQTISCWMNMSVMRMDGNDWECLRMTHI